MPGNLQPSTAAHEFVFNPSEPLRPAAGLAAAGQPGAEPSVWAVQSRAGTQEKKASFWGGLGFIAQC